MSPEMKLGCYPDGLLIVEGEIMRPRPRAGLNFQVAQFFASGEAIRRAAADSALYGYESIDEPATVGFTWSFGP